MVKTRRVVYGKPMKSRLKQMIPLALRQEIKRQILKREDRRDPITAPRVPPRAETFIGGGDFERVGDEFFEILKRHDLNPDMDILDVGCGQGRMARPLAGFLDRGSYHGFDIVPSGINWCNTHYADAPNFIFQYVPIFNKRYNKSGTVKASEFVFPFENNSFDLIFLTSVFTHMFAEDVENYLNQIARVLRPGGKCLITWFILNDDSRSAADPFFDFAFDFDKVSQTTTPKSPESAIAFDENYIRDIYQNSGLEIADIEYGTWANSDSPYQLQDMILASPKTTKS